MTDTDFPDLPIFENVSPEEIARLAVAALQVDVELSPEAHSTFSGVSAGSLIAYASHQVAETVAQLLQRPGGEINDDSSLADILDLAASAALASFVEGFALASKLNELTQEGTSSDDPSQY